MPKYVLTGFWRGVTQREREREIVCVVNTLRFMGDQDEKVIRTTL